MRMRKVLLLSQLTKVALGIQIIKTAPWNRTLKYGLSTNEQMAPTSVNILYRYYF